MSEKRETLGDRVARIRTLRGISQQALADGVLMTQQGIAAIEAGGAKHPRKLRDIARFLGVSEAFLLCETDEETGRTEPTAIPLAEAEQNAHGIDDSFTVNGSGKAAQGASFATVGARRRIPGSILEADVRPGAGEGALGEVISFAIGEETYSAHAVTGEWVIPPGTLEHHLQLEASSSLVLRITGDSMEPTFRSGDPVLVDLRVREFADDGIYVFSEPGEAPRVKRLQRIVGSRPKRVRILSDNPAYREDEIDADALIIHGRVGAVVIPK